MKRRCSVVIAVVLLALCAVAPALADDVYSPETLKIARELQCPVCQGESVADSGSELARQMRALIEQKVQAGESEEQIKAYFVERYGPSILAEPPKSGFSLTLWWAPVLVLLVGALIVGLFLHERTRAGRSATPAPASSVSDAELDDIAREVLNADAPGKAAPT